MNVHNHGAFEAGYFSFDLREGRVAPFARRPIDFEVKSVKHDVTIDAVHDRPNALGTCIAIRRVGACCRNVGVLKLFDLAGKSKLPFFGVCKRQLFQIAFDFDANVLKLAF